VLLAAVVLAALAVSGCEKRAGLLADQRAAGARSGPAPAASSAKPAPPRWRLAEAAASEPTSVLWDVTAVDATHAWAVGHEKYSPDQPDTSGVPIVDEWDGDTWSRMDLPGVTWHGGLRLVAAASATDIWAVGGSAGPDLDDTITRILRHDGTSWTEVPFAEGNSPSIMQITDLAVSGEHAWLIGNKGSEVVIQEWDGSAWRRHIAPDECRQGGTSFGGMPTFCNVTGITAFAPDDVWVAGNGAWPGFKGPLLFHWDGTKWAAVPVGITNAETAFSEVAGSPGDLWAVGHTAGYGGPIAVHGDGREWEVVEGLPVARFTDIAVDESGAPWVLENFSAGAKLATHASGRWAGTDPPFPEDAVGGAMQGITAVPGTPNMLAVGYVDLPTEPRLLRSVVLEYAG
jgi:hypothetical protein